MLGVRRVRGTAHMEPWPADRLDSDRDLIASAYVLCQWSMQTLNENLRALAWRFSKAVGTGSLGHLRVSVIHVLSAVP
jgi:hypothetical protein